MTQLTFAADVGLAILALLVQGIIYPSFRHISEEGFAMHHAWYTKRITWFVGPLMIGQVIGYVYRILGVGSVLDWAAVVLVLVAWAVTAAKAVPLHARLAREGQKEDVIADLISANGVRTTAWVLVALLWGLR
jgi:hypothetical protein